MKCLVDNIHKTMIMLLNVIITFLFYMSNAIFNVFSCFTIKSFLGYVNFYCYLISLSSILCHSKGGLDLIPNQLGNLIRLSTTLLHKRDVIGKFNVHIRTTGHILIKTDGWDWKSIGIIYIVVLALHREGLREKLLTYLFDFLFLYMLNIEINLCKPHWSVEKSYEH